MWIEIARALHVAAIVVWIGGVAMETVVILPSIRARDDPDEQRAAFLDIERRFIWPVRLAVLVAGATGLAMADALDAWGRFGALEYWWMVAMAAVWLIFAVVVFVLEPLVLHAWFARRMAQDAAATLALMARLHWILLTVSLATILGAVAGAHGV